MSIWDGNGLQLLFLPVEKKGVAGMEVSKRAYLDQLLPEEIIPEYLARQDASIGLHDLARLNPSKQVE